MNIQEFLDFYEAEISKIIDKFDKIYKASEKMVFFDGEELKKMDYNTYSVLGHHKFEGFSYKISPLPKNEIKISWDDDDGEICYTTVTKSFFDDFDKFLEDVENKILENNKKEESKYQEYLKQLEQEKELNEQKQYQEYLRLKELYKDKSL